MSAFQCIQSADLLPEEWDKLSPYYFSQKEFLAHCERYNPCNQRYYLLQNRKAAAIVYTLRQNIFAFGRLSLPIRMHICGIPCSVAGSGLLGEPPYIHELKNLIISHEKGFVLFLNLSAPAEEGKTATGKTLPSLVINNSFSGFDDYCSALRAPYRRRLNQNLHLSSALKASEIPLSAFTDEMYRQYLAVYDRSRGKLEKLTKDFFTHLGSPFRLKVYEANGETAAWNICLHHNQTHYFFLGGLNYALNSRHRTYFRMLADIVKEGIESGCAAIDLGQTAEVPKSRLGGQPIPLFMEATHSNPLLRRILKAASGMLEYKRALPQINVFKQIAR